jgi:hypothetical protein
MIKNVFYERKTIILSWTNRHTELESYQKPHLSARKRAVKRLLRDGEIQTEVSKWMSRM